MSREDVIQSALSHFKEVFASEPEETTYAPGRVNLSGEHTDYNGGVVFPMPLALGTAVAIAKGGTDGILTMASTSFSGSVTRSINSKPDGSWTDYIVGVVAEFFARGDQKPGLKISVASDLPAGSGLSSSAALEVAVLRALCSLLRRPMSDVDIALMARRAENDFVGMPCGIMDQYSVSVGSPGKAVFLDTRRLESDVIELPKSHRFVVVHSGVTHKLTEDGYEKRVEQCNAACGALGVEMLSDLNVDALGFVLNKRIPIEFWF